MENLDFNPGIDCDEFICNLYYNKYEHIPNIKSVWSKDSIEYFYDTYVNNCYYKHNFLLEYKREGIDSLTNPKLKLKYFLVKDLNNSLYVYFDRQTPDRVRIGFFYDKEESVTDLMEKINLYKSEEIISQGSVYLLVKDRYDDLILKPYDVDYDESNFKFNYSNEFLELNNKILINANRKKSGLFLFHGLQGTGKTFYIKHLIKNVNKKVIFVPSGSADIFCDSSFLDFIADYGNCIIIIEDGEALLMKRSEMNTNPIISAILNLTSGLTGDMLNLQFVITFNCDVNEIDPALMRTGRLLNSYEFKPLSIEKSNALLTKLGHSEQNKEMSLCDIYNFEDYTNNNINQNTNQIGYVTNV